MAYFRVQEKNTNLFEVQSVEIAEENNNISVEQILEMYSVSDVEELEEALQDSETLYFDQDGFHGAGIYYAGVCCCESLEDLKNYISFATPDTSTHLEIVEFDGEWVDSCNDGEVVIPETVIAIHDISILF